MVGGRRSRHNRRVKTLKLISGGQTGADISIVVVGEALGLPIGGMVPAGWHTEAGPNRDLQELGFTESDSADYRVRTRQNVEQSDATLVFASQPDSDGTRLTIDHAARCRKPCKLVDPFSDSAIDEIGQWLNALQPAILNIAGNRESKAPGIQRQAELVLETALRRYLEA